MEHATYLRQLFPTLTLFGVMVFSGASCTETSKTNVVQENNRKCPSQPLSKIDGKNGAEKSDKDQKGEKSDTDQKEEGGSGRPQASTPNPPVASPPVVEPNNPAGVAVPSRDCVVSQLCDALDSSEVKEKLPVPIRNEMRNIFVNDDIVTKEFSNSGLDPIPYCYKFYECLMERARESRIAEARLHL